MNFKKCKQGHSQETTTSDLFLAVCRQLCAGIELTLDPSRVKMSITHGLLFAVMSQSYVALLYPFFLIHLCIKAGITYLKLIIDRIIAKVSQRSQTGIHRQTKRVLNNLYSKIGYLILSILRDAQYQALIFTVTYSDNVIC